MLRDTFCMSKSTAKVLNSFEYSEWKITSGSFRLLLVVVYRPPYCSNHPVTVNPFIEEFSQYLETIIMSTDPLPPPQNTLDLVITREVDSILGSQPQPATVFQIT